MRREMTLIEKMGVEFEERNGLFYSLINGNDFSAFDDYVKCVMREVVNTFH